MKHDASKQRKHTDLKLTGIASSFLSAMSGKEDLTPNESQELSYENL